MPLETGPLNYLGGLPATAHALLPFEDTSSRDQAVLRYAREAINKNKAVIHLCNDPDRDRQLILQSDVKLQRPDQVRVMAVQEVYSEPLNVTKTIDFWRREADSAMDRGFSGLAESADGTSVLSEGLLEFETALGRTLSIKHATALCLYDARRLNGGSGDLLIRLLAMHGHVIFPGLAGRLY